MKYQVGDLFVSEFNNLGYIVEICDDLQEIKIQFFGNAYTSVFSYYTFGLYYKIVSQVQ
jgi:hypothetical protein